MRFELTTLVVIGAKCTGSCNSNYNTITTTTAPQNISIGGQYIFLHYQEQSIILTHYIIWFLIFFECLTRLVKFSCFKLIITVVNFCMRNPAILPLVVINAGNKQLQNILNVLSIRETYSPSTKYILDVLCIYRRNIFSFY